MRTFTHESFMPAPAEQVTDLHDRPETFKMLAMPPLVIQVLRDDRRSLSEGEVEFNLWFGPVPIRWVARHEAGPTPTSFRDVQLTGPHRTWEHEHVFVPVEGGTRLVDRIRIEHEPGLKGWISRLMFDGPLLKMLFMYRHWQTRRILARETGQKAGEKAANRRSAG
jgi:ligand-binding SRPBCC domain-containing protein